MNPSSLVIDTLYNSINQDNVAVACIYCDFHAHEEQSAASVFAALLKQLVAGVEPIPETTMEAFTREKIVGDFQTLQLPEIRVMLSKLLSSLRRGFICIDGLDEFLTKKRPELWESLQYVIRECPNIRLFITGRPHIREEVGRYFPADHNLVPIIPTMEDVGGYVTGRLTKDTETDAIDAELKAEILKIIPDKISGSYVASLDNEFKVIG